jgi:glutamate racemase
MRQDAPILILDSGLGGLTVARAIRELMPQEDIVYFGDTARLPYGSKSGATVTGFVRQIISYFKPFSPKHVVIACNTATALALPAVRKEFPDLSISGVIEPGAKAAVIAAGSRHAPVIGVIATEATIRSKAYDRAILHRRHHARLLLQPAPLLAPIVEEARKADDPLIALALEQYLRPMLERAVDVLVLGCTHYPMLKAQIVAVAAPPIAIIDSAEECAQDVARRLAVRNLLRDKTPGWSGNRRSSAMQLGIDILPQSEAPARPGKLRCFVTDDSPRFGKLASRFLGFDVPAPTWVSTDELYDAVRPKGSVRALV